MKKLFILLLASAFVFAACSNGNNKTDEPEQLSGATTTSTTSGNGSGNTGGGTQTITYIGTKAPGEAKEVGDIVFNDGSATPYTSDLELTENQKSAVIAIIFYKGTGLNSDVYGEDSEGNVVWTPGSTTKSRTLGVGLKHGKNLAWCTNSANAYNINIKTIQCPHSGTDRALTFTGDKDGSDNLEQIENYLINNSISNDIETAANYPAFYFAKNYSSTAENLGTAYAAGWYLPTIAELFQIYANGVGDSNVFDIDAAISLCGGEELRTDYCWSSSQFASTDNNKLAYDFDLVSGPWNDRNKKEDDDYVCAIREFN